MSIENESWVRIAADSRRWISEFIRDPSEDTLEPLLQHYSRQKKQLPSSVVAAMTEELVRLVPEEIQPRFRMVHVRGGKRVVRVVSLFRIISWLSFRMKSPEIELLYGGNEVEEKSVSKRRAKPVCTYVFPGLSDKAVANLVDLASEW